MASVRIGSFMDYDNPGEPRLVALYQCLRCKAVFTVRKGQLMPVCPKCG